MSKRIKNALGALMALLFVAGLVLILADLLGVYS